MPNQQRHSRNKRHSENDREPQTSFAGRRHYVAGMLTCRMTVGSRMFEQKSGNVVAFSGIVNA